MALNICEISEFDELMKSFCRYECIESDLLDSLNLGSHRIAPYKSKGIERASELSSCWDTNLDATDEYLPSDGNGSGNFLI